MNHAARKRPEGKQWLWLGLAALLLGLFLVVPLVAIFVTAFAQGADVFFQTLLLPDTLSALRLTALAVGIAVPINTVFGICVAWAICNFQFRGKNILISMIDLPLAVSPIVVGLSLVLVFGARGLFGPFLRENNLQVVYAWPAIVLATMFVTVPFVARELIPVMQALGHDDEVAARSLGANGFQIFWRVTLPKIRWAVLYGVIVCTARAMGEFGAVSVVSGHIRGETNTIPLHIEVLYQEYNQTGAFAVASTLSVLGLVGLIAKKLLEYRIAKQESQS